MNASQLSPAEKTAILMITLGEDIAADLFRQMDPDDARKVGAALSRIGKVDPTTVEVVMAEFHQILTSPASRSPAGGFGFTKRVLEKAFHNSPTGKELTEQISRQNVEMHSLDLIDGETLANLLRQEHPQTLALVLAHATPQKSSEILKHLPQALHTEVLKRVAQLSEVDPAIVQEIDDHLREEIHRMGTGSKKIGGLSKAAAILNAMGTDHQPILDRMEERDPQLSEQIRAEMFTFEDLKELDDASLRTLYQAVAKDTWIMALRGASEELKQAIHRNLSERASKLLAEDCEALGPQRLTDVRAAREDILNQAQKMADAGTISIDRQEEPKVV
jgi:flagellar motor switch protein FliG